jgi:pyruvate/2-oxoglutarate dehydrogenase complex dihydrolipoamide acyltransferase (E2) component
MREPIVVPELDCNAMVLSVWYVKPGEAVFTGDRLVELLLGGATFDITAPASGTMLEQCARPGEQLRASQVVGFFERSDD